jgi:ABC-type transporter Mla MlaB component
MLRITLRKSENGSIVQLAGRLGEEAVGEARKECAAAEPPLLIDAAELREADADGLALLAELLNRGDRVEGLSRYLAMRVEALRERGGP